MEIEKPKILQRQDAYVFEYPIAIEYADKQNSVFWTHDEIKLEKDIQDILVNMTESERHGVITVLKLFTHYELAVGNEYWGGRVKKTFKRPEIGRMADSFTFFETNVHAPFYNKINELLHLNTEEFYNSYVENPQLKERMEFIDAAVADKDILYSLGVFSMVEGAILYSSFAFLKHFQSQGKNKLKNLVAGINFSVRDENLHSEGGSWLFRTLLSESRLTPEKQTELFDKIKESARTLQQHEYHIIDMIFEKGRIDGITPHQMKVFVDSRINLCLQNLGVGEIFEVGSNPVADWFYFGISQTIIHDFFQNVGNQYKRTYSESEFEW